MKRLLVAAVLLSGAAQAADLGVRKGELLQAAPVWTWSGFYLGAAAGGARSDWTIDSLPVLGGSANGFVGGVYAGYNWQLSPWFVLGVETDIMGSTLSGTTDLSGKNGNVPFALQAEDKLNWLGTTRARFGVTPWQSVLVYGTGGLAYGGVKDTLTQSIGSSSIASSFATSGSDDATRLGWAAGAGAEFAITPHLLARAEYLHWDLGTADWFVGDVPVSVAHKGDLIRGGLSYKW